MILPCQRQLFDLGEDEAYLNCAYMSPIMRAARDAGLGGLEARAHPWTIRQPDDFFRDVERARGLLAGMIGTAADDVAIVPAVSYGIAVAAANLTVRPGQRILVLEDQFPSSLYPWRALAERSGGEVVTVPRPADDDWTAAILARLDPRVAILALPNCHWTDGGLIDLEQAGTAARAVGAALVLDLTQSLGALPFDVRRVDPDFMVAATYKWLLGPYSLGFLYVAPRHHGGRPIEQGYLNRRDAEVTTRRLDYIEEFQPGARRYDMGEKSNFVLLPMAIAALEQLLAWGVENIAETLARGTAEIATRAAKLGLESSRRRAGHFIGLRFPAGPPAGLTERLAAERIHVSLRGTSLRVTPHLYNTPEEIDRLFRVLGALL